MTHALERGLGLTAHALGRGVWGSQVWMGLFKFLQFSHQPIVFNVRDGGFVQDVIAVCVRLELLPQIGDLKAGV
jgi:hypothetical protein